MRSFKLPKIGSFRLGLGLSLLLIFVILGLILPWFAPVNPLTWLTAHVNI